MKTGGTFWRSVRVLVGSVIGVGVFGLPYVFAQSGYAIGVLHLTLIASVSLVVLLLYADIVINTDGHSRLPGLVKRYLGSGWSHVATALIFLGNWGAMVAYIIVGGGFLHSLLGGVLHGSVLTYQILFFCIAGFLLIGGLTFVTRLHAVTVATMLFVLVLLLVGSIPFLNVEHLVTVQPSAWFAPFGVVLFAFGGLSAIPEMAHVLGRNKRDLRRSVSTGVGIIFLVYLLFTTTILAVTGSGTTEEAIFGLGTYLGNWAVIAGSIAGLLAVLSCFLFLGVSVADTLVYDYKQRYLASWALAIAVPFCVFLFGAREFIQVIGTTGAVLGGLTGLLVLYTYWKAKRHVCTPKNCLTFPSWVIFACGIVLLVGIGITLLQ